jgi:hypothetical protein
MRPKFPIGASVSLKDGRYRIPATVTKWYETWEGPGKSGTWHGITYDLALCGGNHGQYAEGVRESKVEAR